MLQKILAQNIKARREMLNGGDGISQAELAKRLDVDVMTISRWERSQSEPETLEKLDNLARSLELAGAHELLHPTFIQEQYQLFKNPPPVDTPLRHLPSKWAHRLRNQPEHDEETA